MVYVILYVFSSAPWTPMAHMQYSEEWMLEFEELSLIQVIQKSTWWFQNFGGFQTCLEVSLLEEAALSESKNCFWNDFFAMLAC
jgi:hypothetical protein